MVTLKARKGKRKGKVLVAMSGGVDSSVAALNLHREGYDVIGVTMKLFCYGDIQRSGGMRTCCSVESARAAAAVAETIGIPHTVIDMEKEFKHEVLRNFFEEYSKGRTPNPCVLCNSKLKFFHLLKRGIELGAQYIATGHYARIGISEKGGKIRYSLKKAIDREKDQSYFLWEMNQDVLAHTLFPLGKLSKAEVREIAKGAGLHVAESPESQDFCFLPMEKLVGTGLADALLDELGIQTEATTAGPIVDTRGERIGTHRGIAYFTTGQRRGLGLALGRPAYVVRIEPETNTLVVGFEEDLRVRRFSVEDVNWISGQTPGSSVTCHVKVRSRSEEIPATICPTGIDSAVIELHESKKAVTPGQSTVWYEGSELIGGGIINKTVLLQESMAESSKR
ncbi:MAG: tRNA 2-thiouridine(34) synthase MnmA [Candidatus Glassbacteria bacterium]